MKEKAEEEVKGGRCCNGSGGARTARFSTWEGKSRTSNRRRENLTTYGRQNKALQYAAAHLADRSALVEGREAS